MNKYGYKEIRQISMTKLRGLCISKNWFTKGDIKQYETLLNYSNKNNITTDDIVEMAEQIIEHSSNIEQDFTSICFDIAKECYMFFEEI